MNLPGKVINPFLYEYVLLDLAGNIEDEKLMTALEAEEENGKLLAGERFLRWAPKDGKVKNVYISTTN